MDIEFKEKPYESAFGHEIARLTNITFAPDQIDEEILGFDGAVFLPLPLLKGLAPYRRRRRWSRMSGIELQKWDRIGEDLGRRLPDWRFNLFVQYKRPVYLKTKGAGEWKHWQSPYYRYQITQHQQDALKWLDEHSQGRAATIYASPAFWEAQKLWEYTGNEKIVANSNIASVGKLIGHEHYSYTQPGFRGKGHSETEDVDSPTIEAVISKGIENDPLPFNQHIKRMAGLIMDAVGASAPRDSLFEAARTAIGAPAFDGESFSKALATIEVFSAAYDVSYYALG